MSRVLVFSFALIAQAVAADYLLNSLSMTRMPHTSISTDTLRQTSRAQRGQFIVLGFGGASGQEHMLHLKHIDRFWNHVPLP